MYPVKDSSDKSYPCFGSVLRVKDRVRGQPVLLACRSRTRVQPYLVRLDDSRVKITALSIGDIEWKQPTQHCAGKSECSVSRKMPVYVLVRRLCLIGSSPFLRGHRTPQLQCMPSRPPQQKQPAKEKPLAIAQKAYQRGAERGGCKKELCGGFDPSGLLYLTTKSINPSCMAEPPHTTARNDKKPTSTSSVWGALPDRVAKEYLAVFVECMRSLEGCVVSWRVRNLDIIPNSEQNVPEHVCCYY